MTTYVNRYRRVGQAALLAIALILGVSLCAHAGYTSSGYRSSSSSYSSRSYSSRSYSAPARSSYSSGSYSYRAPSTTSKSTGYGAYSSGSYKPAPSVTSKPSYSSPSYISRPITTSPSRAWSGGGNTGYAGNGGQTVIHNNHYGSSFGPSGNFWFWMWMFNHNTPASPVAVAPGLTGSAVLPAPAVAYSTGPSVWTILGNVLLFGGLILVGVYGYRRWFR